MLLTLVSALCLFWTACSGDRPPIKAKSLTNDRTVSDAVEKSDNPKPRVSKFSQVDLLCNALGSESLPTRSWKNLLSAVPEMPPEYACLSSMLDIGPEGPMGLATNITYYVYGKKQNAADNLKLVVNINNPSSKEAAKLRLIQVSKSLFRKLEWDIPPELEKAVRTNRPTKFIQPYTDISFEIDKSKIETLSIRVTSR